MIRIHIGVHPRPVQSVQPDTGQFVFLFIFSDRFSEALEIPRFVENVVGYLEKGTQTFAELLKLEIVFVSRQNAGDRHGASSSFPVLCS